MSSILRKLTFWVVVLLAGFASADTVTYTYTGNPLETFAGSPPAGLTQIQATFTLAGPLASNLAFTYDGDGNLEASNIPIIAFTIQTGDGVSTLTENSGGLFVVQMETDASGGILHWLIFATDTQFFETSTLILGTSNHPDFGVYDVSCRGEAPDCANFSFSPNDLGDIAVTQDSAGKWNEERNVNAVPEPSSIVLLGSGLLSVAGAVRRKLIA